MLPRRLAPLISRDLTRYPAVALLGPRQVGKTTLARILGKASHEDESANGTMSRKPEYLDLENPADLAKLDDVSAYLRS